MKFLQNSHEDLSQSCFTPNNKKGNKKSRRKKEIWDEEDDDQFQNENNSSQNESEDSVPNLSVEDQKGEKLYGKKDVPNSDEQKKKDDEDFAAKFGKIDKKKSPTAKINKPGFTPFPSNRFVSKKLGEKKASMDDAETIKNSEQKKTINEQKGEIDKMSSLLCERSEKGKSQRFIGQNPNPKQEGCKCACVIF